MVKLTGRLTESKFSRALRFGNASTKVTHAPLKPSFLSKPETAQPHAG